MKAHGFTVIEVLVVIIVMAILLTLAVVNVRSTQVNARNTERITDVENTALRLESYYDGPASSSSGGGSRYPGTNSITLSGLKTLFPDFDLNNVRHPNNDDTSTIDLVPATNNKETPSEVTPKPDTETYVYQAINTDGTLCTNNASQSCRRFNIYYLLEKDSTVQVLKSKNR